MEPFIFVYLFYIAKISCQMYIYFVSLAYPTTPVIIYVASSVPILSVAPVIHVFAYIFKKKYFSDLSLILYSLLSIMLGVMWYRPTMAAGGSALFILVTLNDANSFLAFLLYKLRVWYRKPAVDPEQQKYSAIKPYDVRGHKKQPHRVKRELVIEAGRNNIGGGGSIHSSPFNLSAPQLPGTRVPEMIEVERGGHQRDERGSKVRRVAVGSRRNGVPDALPNAHRGRNLRAEGRDFVTFPISSEVRVQGGQPLFTYTQDTQFPIPVSTEVGWDARNSTRV